MPEPVKSDTRVAKGQITRDRMLAEALRLFAVKGFEAVGTRELAAAAGTNIAAITFHFGGKEGLYGEVVRRVAGDLARQYRAVFDAVTDEGDAAAEEPLARTQRVMAKLVGALLSSRRSQWMSLLLQREFITPTPAFDALYDEAIKPCLEEFSRLVELSGGFAVGSFDSRVLAYTLFTMASAFSRNRNFLRFAERTEYSSQDIEQIGRTLAGFLEHGLRFRP
ncbi:CerR family C-terminal domain-containing protein [Humidesulfovibrio idahonensis]